MPRVSTKESLIPVVRGECPIVGSIRSLGLPTRHITHSRLGAPSSPIRTACRCVGFKARRGMNWTGSKGRNRIRP